MLEISIHALVKRATACKVGKQHERCISIHALVKRATAKISSALGKIENFNPRPREEGDASRLSNVIGMNISIHALVKRATDVVNATPEQLKISIHALVKRAT